MTWLCLKICFKRARHVLISKMQHPGMFQIQDLEAESNQIFTNWKLRVKKWGSKFTVIIEGHNWGSKFRVKIQGQNWGSKFKVKIQGQNSGSKFRVKIQGQNSGSKFRVKIQGQNSRSKFRVKIQSHNWGSKFRVSSAGDLWFDHLGRKMSSQTPNSHGATGVDHERSRGLEKCIRGKNSCA